MTLAIQPMSGTLGAIAAGIDLSAGSDPQTTARLRQAFDSYSVLCIRGQQLSPAQLVDVARLFGTPKEQINKHAQFSDFPQIGILSSEAIDVHGTRKRVVNGATWHTDHSFTAQPPAATLLYAIEIPETGGDTSFCNTRAAYDALPPATRSRIDSLRAVHTYESSRATRKMLARTTQEIEQTPDVIHPLVRTHVASGKKALYMSTTRLECIADMPREQSDALIDELLDHATQSQFLFNHKWQVGDVLIWDNRCTMHHANADYPLEARRYMQRILIEGEIPV